MPMLEWAGKKKVVNHHNAVPYHVLEQKWAREDEAHTEARGCGRREQGLTILQTIEEGGCHT